MKYNHLERRYYDRWQTLVKKILNQVTSIQDHFLQRSWVIHEEKQVNFKAFYTERLVRVDFKMSKVAVTFVQIPCAAIREQSILFLQTTMIHWWEFNLNKLESSDAITYFLGFLTIW